MLGPSRVLCFVLLCRQPLNHGSRHRRSLLGLCLLLLLFLLLLLLLLKSPERIRARVADASSVTLSAKERPALHQLGSHGAQRKREQPTQLCPLYA